MSLEPGMFVAELDRPWLETPFALQGFVVRDTEEVLYVSHYVEHVYVDAEYKGHSPFISLVTEPTATNPRDRLQLREDFLRARVCFHSAAESLDKVFASLRAGRQGDMGAVREVVNPLIESVFRNQEAFAALLRLKESGEYRYHHSVSMAVWAAILGRQIGLHRDELEKLAIGCTMCDVGMTQLPLELLGQAESLSPEQVEVIRAHPLVGAEMVSASKGVDFEVLAIVENHHERMDGSGYPRGIEGAAIPVLARIAGLVDTYDAMITHRPYATARTSHEAAQELIDCKGILFQEAMVEQFVQAIGLFPTGTLVELNTGEVGIVVKQSQTRRLKPEVVLVLDENKEKMEPLAILDLSNQRIAAKGERWIARELLPGTYDINSEDYFI